MLVLSQERDDNLFILDRLTHRAVRVACIDIRPGKVRLGFESHASFVTMRESTLHGNARQAEHMKEAVKGGLSRLVPANDLGMMVDVVLDGRLYKGIIASVLPVNLVDGYYQVLVRHEHGSYLVADPEQVSYTPLDQQTEAQKLMRADYLKKGGEAYHLEVDTPLQYAPE